MIADLLSTPELPDLGPGMRKGVEPEAKLNDRVRAMLSDAAVSGTRAELVRAVVLLWHDHLDAAHRIVQDIETPEGSYLHAIMHRREPDYGNAKYWFRRVGKHPCFARLASLAGAREFVKNGDWDPFAFVDACERSPQSEALRQLQAEEFRILLHYLVEGR